VRPHPNENSVYATGTHVVFTSSNIQNFQHEKPFICQNAQNCGNTLAEVYLARAVMSTSATLGLYI